MANNEESSPSGQHLTEYSEQQSPSARRSHIDTRYLVPPPSDATLNSIKAGERVPLSDLTLYIPARTKDVQGVDAGINRIAVTSHEEGLLIGLLPALELAALDRVDCYWGTFKEPVAQTIIQKHQLDGHHVIVLFVPRSVISDGLVSTYIKVTRVSQAVGETRKTLLKVDTRQPGGENPASPLPVNPNLRKPIIDQSYLKDGISETNISNGKCIAIRIPSYPADTSLPPPTHRAERDVIHLKIGDKHTFKHTVLPEEVGTYQDIVIDVCQSDWQSIGNGYHACSFNVEDEVGNISDGSSEAEYLKVDLDGGAKDWLPACHFEDVDEDGKLDLSKVIGPTVNILVLIDPRNYAIGDAIWVSLSGTAAGLPVRKTYSSGRLQSTTSRLLRIPCPVIDLEPLTGSRCFLQYERIRDDKPNLGSFITEVYVTGTGSGGLRAPNVREAVNGRILNDLTQVHVDIKVDGFGYYDQIELHVLGKSPGHNYYDNTFDKVGSGQVSFELIRGLGVPVALLTGGSLEIWYFAISADGRYRSPTTTVYIDARYAALRAPEIDEAPPPNYEFDVGRSEKANIWVRANTDIKGGDTVILYARGDAPGGTPPTQTFPIDSSWEGRDLPFKVDIDYIKLNKQMDISYERVRSNIARPSQIVPMKIITQHDLPAPLVYNSTPLDDENATIDLKMADNTPNVTVRVQFTMSEQDLIKLELTGRPGIALPNIEPQYGNPRVGYVLFVFPNWVLAYLLADVLRIQYHVTNNGSTRDSRVLNLRVLGFDEIPGGNPLPLPTLNSLKPGSVLDLNTVSSNYCWVDLAKWPTSREGQRIWLKCHSTDAFKPLTLLNGDPITQEQAKHGIVRQPAELGWFTALPDGSPVIVTAAVGYTDRASEAEATLFPSSTYFIKALRLSDFTDFEVFFWNGWANLINGFGEITNFNNNNYWHAKLSSGSPIRPGVIKSFFIKSARTYRISFKMKVDLSPYQPQAFVEFGSQSKDFVYIHEGNWYTYHLDFALPAGAPSQDLQLRISFKSGSAPAEFSLDDILVAELP